MNFTTLRVSSSLALLLFLASVAHCQTTYEAPFSRIVEGSCVGESLALTGTLRTSVKQTVVAGGIRIEIREFLKGTGTGLDSGTKYNLNGKTTTRIILTTEALDSYTFKSNFQCVGVGPADNLTINYTFRQTTDGVVVESFEAACK